MSLREPPAASNEFGWREFGIYCDGHDIGNHPDLWYPWWEIWKIAYNLGKASKPAIDVKTIEFT